MVEGGTWVHIPGNYTEPEMKGYFNFLHAPRYRCFKEFAEVRDVFFSRLSVDATT